MVELVDFPVGLRSMLENEDVTWYDVWKPLKKAIDEGSKVAFGFNISGYEYDPSLKRITVHGLTVDDGEVYLSSENFRANMAQFLRGAPKC